MRSAPAVAEANHLREGTGNPKAVLRLLLRSKMGKRERGETREITAQYQAERRAALYAHRGHGHHQACGLIGQTAYERLRTRAMILTLRYTALRIGDVAMLARDRIGRDGDRWRIFLRTEKSGQPVFLPVPPDMKAALDAVPAPRGSNGESRYFFWSGTSTEKALKANVDRSLGGVFKKSGVADAHAHRFRHTLATELLGRGASFEDVADILGNSPEIVRKHYAKWSPARQITYR